MMSLVVERGGVRQHSQNASRGHQLPRAPGQVRSAYSRGPGQPRAVPWFLARHPSPPLFSCVVGHCLRREGHEELGLALLGVGLERAVALPLPLDLGFQLEEGVSTRVGLRRGRWGRHRCRARLGFAVALRVLLLLAVQGLRSDWRASDCSRCDSRPRVVSQTAIYA